MSRALYADAWSDLGAFAHAVVQAELGGPVDRRLFAAASGLSEAVPAEGGFLVPDQFASALWDRATAQGRILSRCAPQPMSGTRLRIPATDEVSRLDGSRQGGVRGYWANEAETVAASKPKFRSMQLELRKVMCVAYATDELMADSAALGPWLERALASEITFKVEDAIVAGDGVTKPLGYLNSPALVEVAAENGQQSGTFVAANAKRMLAATWIGSRGNLAWLVHPDLEPALLSLENGSGAALFGYAEDGVGRLLGRPVIPVEYASPPAARGDIALVDLSQYVITERPADFAQSMHLRFLQDEGVFRLSLRVDGQPAWHSPVTPYKGSTPQSPFVVLGPRP
jgi:HK97 family phage major capsid protein